MGSPGTCVQALIAVMCMSHLASSLNFNLGESKIVRGKAIGINKAPFMVMVQSRFGHEVAMCGGTIIDKNWILTAAHCCFNKKLVAQNNVTITAGTADNRKGGIRVTSSKVITHSGYYDGDNAKGDYLPNDIALIKTSKPLQLSRNVRPAVLQRQVPREGDSITVAGWGDTNGTNPNDPGSPLLLHTNVKILAHAKCEKQLKSQLLKGQICAAKSAGYPCHGDSGGPLFNGSRAVGIVSFSAESDCRGPTVYTSIPEYIDWIRKNTGISSL